EGGGVYPRSVLFGGGAGAEPAGAGRSGAADEPAVSGIGGRPVRCVREADSARRGDRAEGGIFRERGDEQEGEAAAGPGRPGAGFRFRAGPAGGRLLAGTVFDRVGGVAAGGGVGVPRIPAHNAERRAAVSEPRTA